jgi:hypothetical protein
VGGVPESAEAGYISNMKWWDWLGTLPQGQATFLGSFVGLAALLVAALVNAHLNRRRDDRVRAEERRSVGTALRADLAGFKDTLVENSETLSHAQEDHEAFFCCRRWHAQSESGRI